MLPTRDERRAALGEIARVLRAGGILCGRALTPREDRWLAAQPFRSSAIGFSAEDILAEAQPFFTTRILGQTPHLLYYLLSRIA